MVGRMELRERVRSVRPFLSSRATNSLTCPPCRLYDCGHHACDRKCHAHRSSTPLPCPLSPSTLTTCPCGATPLSVLLPSPRTSCLSPVPTCARRCTKIHNCGHEWYVLLDVLSEQELIFARSRKPCHPGDCGSCDEMIPIVCRCGTTKVRLSSLPSSQY